MPEYVINAFTGQFDAVNSSSTPVDVADGGTGRSSLTDHAILIGSGTDPVDFLGPSATAGQIVQSAGSSSDPVFSTNTYPSTNSQGDLIYGSATNVYSNLAKDTNATRYLSNTGASNNPAWAQIALSTGVTGTLPLSNGGTSASLTASNGGVFYSTATAGAILSGTATANRILMSGSSAAPSWSTATYPVTTTANRILFSSASNVISEIVSANNGVLITSAGGVPNFLANGTTGQVLTATTGSPPSWGPPPVSFTWSVIAANQALAVNNGYVVGTGALSLSLPASAAVGDTIEVVLEGGTSWTITQGAGQQIRLGNATTTSGAGGSLASAAQGDWVQLVCRTANTFYVANAKQGNITIV